MKEHYYYAPRVLIDDVINTSENIIVTTACLGGAMWKGTTTAKEKILSFAIANKDRVFFEVQHHDVEDQKKYNLMLYELSKAYGVKLIAGTDTHSLNATHAKGRLILQKATNTFFSDEEGWDLTFKSYEELVDAYSKQNVLPKDVYMEAIHNTNLMADMVEEFTLDRSSKYPKIYENSRQVFEEKIRKRCLENKYIQERYTPEEIEYIRKRLLTSKVGDKENYIFRDNEYTVVETYVNEDKGFTPALHTLIKRSNGVGFTNSNVDSDGIRRRMELFYEYDGKYLPQLVFGPLMDAFDTDEFTREKYSLTVHNAKVPGKDERVDIKIPLDEHGRMLINWQHEEKAESMYASIDLVCDKLERQVKKFKEKGLSKAKNESIRTTHPEEVEA